MLLQEYLYVHIHIYNVGVERPKALEPDQCYLDGPTGHMRLDMPQCCCVFTGVLQVLQFSPIHRAGSQASLPAGVNLHELASLSCSVYDGISQ